MRRHAAVAAGQAASSWPESLASGLELLTNEIWTFTESGESRLTWPPRNQHRNRHENRALRRLRGHAGGQRARGVRDQHLRGAGDDAGSAAPLPGAPQWCGGERDLERDAGADADGGGVHREQGGIEGSTASLAFELDAFNVGVKLVERGYGPSTRFTSNTDRAWKG